MLGLVALAACGEPLGKQAMITGCHASAVALSPGLASAALDYRAVVGREAILRFQTDESRTVNAKCKVSMRGHLQRIKLEAVRARGRDLDKAKAAFEAAIRP